MKLGDPRRGRGPAARGRWSESVARSREDVVLLGEDLQDLVRRAERRVRAADRLVEVLARGRPAPPPSSLMMIARRWRCGQAHHVVDEVGVDRLGRALDGQQVLALALLARPRSSRAPAARPRPAGRGSVSVHSTYFSPMSDCGRIAHFASWRKSWKFVSMISRTAAALLSFGDVELLDLADVHARDADVLALDDRERVVEDHADLVVAALVVAGARAEHDDRRGGGDEGDDERARRLTGPPARVGGRSRGPLSWNGAEPSAAGWLAAPGQRRVMPVSRPLSVLSGSCGVRRPPGGVVRELEGVEHRLDAREVAVRVVVRRPTGRSRGTSR